MFIATYNDCNSYYEDCSSLLMQPSCLCNGYITATVILIRAGIEWQRICFTKLITLFRRKSDYSTEMPLSKYLLIVAAAGMTGTTIMTAFMFIMSAITHRQLNVIKVLGSMLTFKATRVGTVSHDPVAVVTGLVVHYLVGLLFTRVYIWLWSHNIVSTDVISTVFLGFLTGLAGAIVWTVFFALHPRPVKVPLKIYLICILVGHIFFAAGVRVTLSAVAKTEWKEWKNPTVV